MKIKTIFMFLVLVFTTIQAGGQVFVLRTLTPDDTFIYVNTATKEVYPFKVVKQEIYGDEEHAIFVNRLNSSAVSLAHSLPTNIHISKDNITIKSNIISTDYINSAKGNLLVSGTEVRDINITTTEYFFSLKNVKIQYVFEKADRAVSVLTGNPIVDTFTVFFGYSTNSTFYDYDNNTLMDHYTLSLEFEAYYLPSISFNFTDPITKARTKAVNVTEQFTLKNAFVEIQTEKIYKKTNSTLQSNFRVVKNDNIFIYTESSGIPSIIEAGSYSFVRPVNFTRMKLMEQSDILMLDDYSWKTPNENITTAPAFEFFIVLIAMSLYYKRKKR
ncbi:MAG: hypothetical protein ACE5ES_00200 [Candidatus Nanoarchaeia archaeon]